MKGIVVTTSEYTKDWLLECLRSIPEEYSILVVGNGGYKPPMLPFGVQFVMNDWNGFELGGVLRGAEYFDEFILIMDTCVIKDKKMIDDMFDHKGGVYLCDGFFSYLGKYMSDVVERIGVPKINTKGEAVDMERNWNMLYLRNDPNAVQFNPSLPIHTDVFEEKHGRKNMILDNGFIIKYKGTWSF